MIFIVLTETTILPKPCKRPLNDPAARQYIKRVSIVAATHDIQYPLAASLHPVNQLSSISSISPDQLKSRQPDLCPQQQFLGAIPVLHVTRMNQDGQHQCHSVYENMTLASIHFLCSIIPTRTPFSVVFTDWLSIMPALGSASLSAASRTCLRRAS